MRYADTHVSPNARVLLLLKKNKGARARGCAAAAVARDTIGARGRQEAHEGTPAVCASISTFVPVKHVN
jgi:hypothetical protein